MQCRHIFFQYKFAVLQRHPSIHYLPSSFHHRAHHVQTVIKHTSVHIYTQLFLKQVFTCCGHPYLGWIFLFEKLEMTHQSNGSPESLSHTSSCQLVSPPRPCTSQSVSFVKENHFIGCTHSTEMDILTLTLLFIKVKGDRDT